MSSSTEAGAARVLRGVPTTSVPAPQLRSGTWTRLGDNTVLGDPVTESTLAGLAEAARSAARAQGYAVGWAEGCRAAEEQAATHRAAQAVREEEAARRRDREHRDALARLDCAVAEIGRATDEVCAAVEERALMLARELTGLILGHELAKVTDTGALAVRRALTLLDDRTTAVLRLCPDDLDSPVVGDLSERLRVVADPSLSPGDAVVQTDEQVIDARIDAALGRVREVLR